MSSHVPVSLLRRLLITALSGLLAVSVAAPADALKAVEPYGSYQPQVSCDPVAKPGVLAFRGLINRQFGGGDLGITRSCSVGGTSEHKEGRAWDYALNWHNPRDRAKAKRVIEWLTEPVARDPARRAKRLGVMYMIWNRRIWSSGGWRPYTGTSPHRDHIHFSFTWNGAMRRTSWYTGRVMAHDYGPCQKWVGEYAPRWRSPRLAPCPEPIRRPRANKNGIYRAQSGETLRRVARFFHISVRQVRVWNGFPRRGPVELYVGQRIRVKKPTVIPPVDKPAEPTPETPDPAPEPPTPGDWPGDWPDEWNGEWPDGWPDPNDLPDGWQNG